jgi:EAL domain-containing protein (putative c-di-GMP-specific phosphodiesterase class I)
MELQPSVNSSDLFRGDVEMVFSFGKRDRMVEKEYTEIRDILSRERVRTVFQPIVDLQTGEVYAYECLSRINGDSRFSGPEPLFEAAARCSLTEELETLCRSRAIRTAQTDGHQDAPDVECVS